MGTLTVGDISKVELKEEFILGLQENPAETLKSVGVEPTDDMLQALSGIDMKELHNVVRGYLEKSPIPYGWP